MNVARGVDVSVALLLVTLLPGCAHTPPDTPPPLPSHPAWEMFPRASSPPSTCAGQYRSVIQDANGDTFLGCWGQKPDATAPTAQ